MLQLAITIAIGVVSGLLAALILQNIDSFRWRAAVLSIVFVGLVVGTTWLANDDGNEPPDVEQIKMSPEVVHPCEEIDLSIAALDPDGDLLIVTWTATYGRVSPAGPTDDSEATYYAPDRRPLGGERLTAQVDDGNGHIVLRQRPFQLRASEANGCGAETREPPAQDPT